MTFFNYKNHLASGGRNQTTRKSLATVSFLASQTSSVTCVTLCSVTLPAALPPEGTASLAPIDYMVSLAAELTLPPLTESQLSPGTNISSKQLSQSILHFAVGRIPWG